MIAYALATLKAEGTIRVQLFVEPENARGIAFYERMGFHKECLMRRAFRRAGEPGEIDDLVMVRFPLSGRAAEPTLFLSGTGDRHGRRDPR